MRTNIIHVALSCKHAPRTGVAYTSYLTSSLNISIGKTLVPSSSVLFTYPSIILTNTSIYNIPEYFYLILE